MVDLQKYGPEPTSVGFSPQWVCNSFFVPPELRSVCALVFVLYSLLRNICLGTLLNIHTSSSTVWIFIRVHQRWILYHQCTHPVDLTATYEFFITVDVHSLFCSRVSTTQAESSYGIDLHLKSESRLRWSAEKIWEIILTILAESSPIFFGSLLLSSHHCEFHPLVSVLAFRCFCNLLLALVNWNHQQWNNYYDDLWQILIVIILVKNVFQCNNILASEINQFVLISEKNMLQLWNKSQIMLSQWITLEIKNKLINTINYHRKRKTFESVYDHTDLINT